MPLLHCVILQVMKNVNRDPSIFCLGRVFPQHVVVGSGRRGGDLIYSIPRVLQSAGADSVSIHQMRLHCPVIPWVSNYLTGKKEKL